jgi:hypothetical protein
MFYIPKSGNLDKSIAVYRNQSRDDMYRIPEKLIIELFDAEII